MIAGVPGALLSVSGRDEAAREGTDPNPYCLCENEERPWVPAQASFWTSEEEMKLRSETCGEVP